MNRSLSILRQLSPAQHHHLGVTDWLDHHGIAHSPKVLPQCACLRLQFNAPDGEVQVLVEANGWAKTNCAPLEGSAWNLIPAQTLRELVAHCSAIEALPPVLAGDSAAVCLGLVNPLTDDVLPTLQGPLGTAWIVSIERDAGAASRAGNPLNGSALSLELRLASLSLGPEVVAALACNDVLRLGGMPMRGSAWLGGHLTHTFIFKDNHVEFDSDLLLQQTSVAPAEQQRNDSLGSLSITLDVVLAHLPITLNSLQTLGKGSVLELPPSAQLNVRIRDAGRLLAIGELVQIGDQLGVQVRSMATGT